MQQQPNLQPQSIEEDVIDLRGLWRTMMQQKMFITLFTTAITFLSLIYLFSVPNTYTVRTALVPIEQQHGSSLAGLGGLAAMAGINIGNSDVGPSDTFNAVLNDYGFMAQFIKANDLHTALNHPDTANYYFAFGFRGIFDLFHVSSDTTIDEEKAIFTAYRALMKMISFDENKKSGIITFSVSSPDSHLAKKISDRFLSQASSHLIANEIKELDSQLTYYQEALERVHDVKMRELLALQGSSIMRSKIILQSSPFYKVKKITEPVIPFYQDKSNPKRGLILVGTVITSLFLGIFIVFFREFARGDGAHSKRIEN